MLFLYNIINRQNTTGGELTRCFHASKANLKTHFVNSHQLDVKCKGTRLRKSEKKALSIEEKMEEIRIVNRAKWLLISELKMDEQGAHRYIEKQAMDRCISKRIVAEEIIKTYA